MIKFVFSFCNMEASWSGNAVDRLYEIPFEGVK